MKLCPKCGSIVQYNSYFGAYICAHCYWEDAEMAKVRSLVKNAVSEKCRTKCEENLIEERHMMFK